MNRTSDPDALRIGFLPGKTPWNNVASYLDRHVARFPDRTAFRWVDPLDLLEWDGTLDRRLPHRSISYAAFAQGVRRVAQGLSELGLAQGDRVIVFLPMSLAMYTALLAVEYIGAIAVFLDSWARRNHLGASAECARPKAMISHHRAFEQIRDMPELDGMPMRIIVGEGEGAYVARLEDLSRTVGLASIVAVESEATALITFTTGSSGAPKGANRTHRFLAAQHEALASVARYREADTDLPAFPIFSLNNMASGVTTVLPALDLGVPSPRDAAALVNQVYNEKIACATLSPSMIRNVAAFCLDQGVKLESLRRVLTGGAPISRDDVSAFRAIAPRSEVWVLYGSTEVEPMAHIEAGEMLSLPSNPDPEIVDFGVNVGRVADGLRFKFIRIIHGPIEWGPLGWEEFELGPREVGEFIVTGDHVCRDYYRNPDAFRETKIVDADGEIWHRTGDLARLDERGYLWIVGRIHNAIDRAGQYYFPVQAEVILRRVPGVVRGAFLGLPDRTRGERTAAAIQSANSETDPMAIANEVQRLFRKNGIPLDSLYFVEELPMDPRHHSKVEYGELRKLILAGRAKEGSAHA
ncbi:MAG: AMP-binding protein [Kiritimatiellia bacterium]|nr:AMP-binding protein [Kiritimatiellia bacterium]